MASLFISLRDAAKLLGLSYNTVRLWAKRRRIPSLRLGRNHYIPRAALEEWIEELHLRAKESVREVRREDNE